jgi:FtsP/CotA-like multicopper oxidase with cupredoxin domain
MKGASTNLNERAKQMKKHTYAAIGGLAMLISGGFVAPASATLISATDVNPDPGVFEFYLTAIEQDVTINGTTVHAMVYKDDPPALPSAGATIPGPLVKVKVGDTIICHFKNNLTSDDASVHWHGLELDNDSDGTAVSQDVIQPNQSYTYVYKTFRPGIFWYHNHILPGNTTFAGMYGVIIVANNLEDQLIAQGKLPAEAATFTLALSDIEFDATGKVGKPYGGGTMLVNELVELCHLNAVDNTTGDRGACGAISVGETVLVNGENPNAAAQTPMFTVPSGKRIRLRLANEAIARHFRLKLLGSTDNNLYRIGGQGGLLDNVRLEGGTLGTWNTFFDPGEIVIGSGDRADVLAFIEGAEGAVVQLVGNPLPVPFRFNTGLPTDYPVAFFKISGTASDTAPAVGDPILAGTAEDVPNIKSAATQGGLVTPPSGLAGSTDATIHLTNVTPPGFDNAVPAIDAFGFPVNYTLEHNLGNGDFLNNPIPQPPTTRYAHVGDLLELSVSNDTTPGAAHPFHLHGFSIQPKKVTDNTTGTTLFDFDYDEFLDTIDVYPGQTLVFRVRLDDRPKLCDLSGSPPDAGPKLASCTPSDCGGAVGRWLFHCHIFSHADLGMIGEFDVLPALDITPPTISNVSIDQTVLWPPDHKMRTVTVNYDATDCSGPPATALSVTSNEPQNGLGDGDSAPDWQIVDAHHVQLRSERSGTGTGRVYTITITATDAFGNVAVTPVTVQVPHNAPR